MELMGEIQTYVRLKYTTATLNDTVATQGLAVVQLR
jgi:hypothetical protein